MKIHTSNFKNEIKKFGRQLDSIITYEISGVETELGGKELNSVTPKFQSNILKSAMKELHIDSNVDIPLNTVINYQFGVLVNGSYEYLDFGNYIVKSSEKQEDTRSYIITCYDMMLKSMIEYKSLQNGTFPMTVRDYIKRLCQDLNLIFANEYDRFANYDKVIENDIYANLGYTYRDIFDELSQVTAGTICINSDDKLEIRYIEDAANSKTSIGENNILQINDGIESKIKADIDGNYSQEVTTGKNKLKVTNLELLKSLNTAGTWNGNVYTHNGITYTVNDDKSILANGIATGSSYMRLVQDLDNLISGTNYTLSGCPQGGGVSKYAVRLYKSDNTYSSEIGLELGFTFSNQTYVRINVFSGIAANNLLFKPMIRLATIADNTYESYTGEQPSPSPDYPQEIEVIENSIGLKITSGNNTDTYTIDLQDEFVGKLPNGVKDELHIDKQGNVTLIKRVGKIIFDGSETDWYYNSSRGGFSINNMIGTPVSPYMLSNNFTCSNSYTTWTGEGKFGVSSSGTLWFKTLIASSVASFKTWLSTHNTEIYYQLRTPYTIDLESISPISIYNGITSIELLNSLNISFTIEYATSFDEINEEYLKDVNVNFAEKYGPINSIVLSRSGESDNVYLRDEESVTENGLCELKIIDNQIMNFNDRSDYLPKILEKLDGLEYYLNDFSSTGICYYDVCDRYRINIFDNIYKCVMLNDEINITQGLEENIYTELTEQSQTDYTKADKTDRKINQAYIIVDKQNQTIEALASQVNSDGTRLNTVEASLNSQEARINVINTNIDENGNVTEVKTTEGFTFNNNGLNISNSDSNFNTQITNESTQYKNGNEVITETSKDGFMTTDLKEKGIHQYSYNGLSYDFVAERIQVESEYAYAHFYNGDE